MPNTSNNTVQIFYKPSELIGIFNSILAKQSVNAQVVFLRGVYLASGRQPYSGYFPRERSIIIVRTNINEKNNEKCD